jgi:hypothetical protein
MRQIGIRGRIRLPSRSRRRSRSSAGLTRARSPAGVVARRVALAE